MTSFEEKLGPVIEAHLEPGETVLGICAASEQRGMFKGNSAAVATTDRRLLIQRLGRRGDPDGDPIAIASEELADAKADGAGGGWAQLTAAIMDGSAVKLRLDTTGGERFKLMLMRGGTGLLGAAGGGEPQRAGLEALAGFLSRAGLPD